MSSTKYYEEKNKSGSGLEIDKIFPFVMMFWKILSEEGVYFYC